MVPSDVALSPRTLGKQIEKSSSLAGGFVCSSGTRDNLALFLKLWGNNEDLSIDGKRHAPILEDEDRLSANGRVPKELL